MQYECKHGLPVRVNLTPPEPTIDGYVGYTWTVTVNMCQECVLDGTAEKIAKMYEAEVLRVAERTQVYLEGILDHE